MKCLEKLIADRYLTASDVARDLRRWQQAGRDNRTLPVALGVVAAILLALATLTFWKSRGGNDEPSQDVAASVQPEKRFALTADELQQLRRILTQQDARRAMARDGIGDAKQPQQKVTFVDGIPQLPAQFTQLETNLRQARLAEDEEAENSLLLNGTNRLIRAGEYTAAESLAKRMVELAGNNPSRRTFAYGQLGLAQCRLGNLEAGIASYNESTKVYRRIYEALSRLSPNNLITGKKIKSDKGHMARLLGLMLMRIGNANKHLERFAEAEASYEEAQALFEENDRRNELLTLFLNYGSLDSARGKYRPAIKTLEQGLRLARQAANQSIEVELLVNLANAHARQGNSDSALRCYEQAAKLVAEDASYDVRAALLSNWALELLANGRRSEAIEKLDSLRKFARANDEAAKRVLRLAPLGSDNR